MAFGSGSAARPAAASAPRPPNPEVPVVLFPPSRALPLHAAETTLPGKEGGKRWVNSGRLLTAFPLQPDLYTDGTGPPRFPGGPSTALQRSRDPGRPVTPRHGGVSGAAPAIATTKAPSLAISRLNSAASLPAVYASRRTLPYAMQHALPAGWLAFAGRGSHPLDRDVGFQYQLTSLPPPSQSLAWRDDISM